MKQSRLLNNIVGGSYEADERIAGCAVSQNLYAESVEEASNGFYYTSALRSVEGERVAFDFSPIAAAVDVNGQGFRGLFVASDDSVFAAFGKIVVRMTKNPITGFWSYETIYTQPLETIGRVRFCETGGINSHVVWIDGTSVVKAYPLDPTKAEAQGIQVPIECRTPLRVYLTSDEIKQDTNQYVRPTSICSLAGSLAINDPENDTWYYTDAYALGGTDYTRKVYDIDADGNIQYVSGTYEVKTKVVNITDVAQGSDTAYLWLDRYSKPKWVTAEYSADNVTGMTTCGDFLFVFGTRSVQVYNQQASTDAQGFSSMVYSSMHRNVQDIGTRNPDTVSVVGGLVHWLGSSERGERSVLVSEGGVPRRISTNAIERELEGKNLEGAFGFGYSSNGHDFYCLTIPSIEKTFCYDAATRQWHNRSTLKDDNTDGAWWVRFAANACGDIVIAGYGVPKMCALDKNKFDDYRGRSIVKRRTCPIIISDFSPFMVNDIQLVWNTGTTTYPAGTDASDNPAVILEVSTDGGNTFDEGRYGYGGFQGQYGHRTIWYGIGSGTMFVFRFTITDRVNVAITGAKISHTRLAHF